MSEGNQPYRLEFPDELPISAAIPRITAALATESVIIVAGATGSGKTTQLPKICLAAGRGRERMIGHTQPRRLAARAVAARIAEELGVPLGATVGYQVRFEDRSSSRSRIKLMTDGVLLNAIRTSRYLDAFDTLIIDEAHERSVNIDFLLAYLKKILPRRRDLRVIVTSATVDTAAFSRYFGDAPVIEVEGRAFPVAIEYAPLGDTVTLEDGVVRACSELAARPLDDAAAVRDMLVFLPGEQSIRDARDALTRSGPPDYEVLPLYARLNVRQQQRVFAPGARPRIVLATNVAETSLTVPRIRYVVDSGLARVRRYSARHRIDALQVEPVARANADQRAGRCGRLAPGTCVRLYAESNYNERPSHTDPEILRTNLAGVLLRVRTLGFGRLDAFPFIDAPDEKFVNDAERLLQVLGAVDANQRLTRDGRVMARLPVDPRVARLLLEGRRRRCLAECLVLAAALSAGDPREAPDSGERSNAPAGAPQETRSDFLVLLGIWERLRSARGQGAAAIRRLCRTDALAEHRLREWEEVHTQLVAITDGLGWKRGPYGASYARLHKALLSGFVDYIATHEERGDYRGMHGVKARLFPGSVVAARPPKWVFAAEHVATARNYLRIVARIEPRWIEEVAPQLLKRQVGEPQWDGRRGCVVAQETTSAFGLVLSADRRVDFGQVDARRAREIFLRDGLAGHEPVADLPFLAANASARDRILEWEARRRSRDLYIGDRGLAEFYDRRLPEEVRDRRTLVDWCARSGNERALNIDWRELITHDVSASVDRDFPQTLQCAEQDLALRYSYSPGEDDDGLTLQLPVVLLDSVSADRLDWLVPGYLEAKVLALLRTLPKELRRPLVPLPDAAAALMPALGLRFGAGSLVTALAEQVTRQFGVAVTEGAFVTARLPPHLLLRTELIGPAGEVIAAGRDFAALRREYGGSQSPLRPLRGGAAAPESGLHTSWDFGDLPERTDIVRFGTKLQLYPALTAAGRGVRLELVPPGPGAAASHRRGVGRLLVLALPQQAALLRSAIRQDRALLLGYHGVGSSDDFVDDVLAATAEAAFEFDADCRSQAQFRQILDRGRERFVGCGEQVIATATEVLSTARDVRGWLGRLRDSAPTAVADMALQLDRLVYPGFLAATPPHWLQQLPRFLRAMQVRCESLRYRNERDRRDQLLAEAAQDRWIGYQRTLPAGWPLPPAVERYRWLTEELRVSLFAQALGTSVPVSGKRLERYWLENIR